MISSWQPALAQDPCAILDAYKKQSWSKSQQTALAAVPVAIAEECLNSVTVNKEEDQALIDEYKLWLEWQSTFDIKTVNT